MNYPNPPHGEHFLRQKAIMKMIGLEPYRVRPGLWIIIDYPVENLLDINGQMVSIAKPHTALKATTEEKLLELTMPIIAQWI